MALSLAGSRVWLTGASSGIGAALALELAARGCTVAASARRRDLLDELAERTQGRVRPVPCDVSDRDAVLRAAQDVIAGLGGIDVAVLNAGMWRAMDVERWDPEVFRRHVEVNLMGMAHGVEAVLPHMLGRRAGTIAGMASVAGYRGAPRNEAYGATKAAQINLLESLRIDLRPRGVRVVTVCPGFVRTEATAQNRFRMPFMVEPADAAREIAHGLERGKAEIVFPRRMMVAMKAARLAPVGPFAAAWSRAATRRSR